MRTSASVGKKRVSNFEIQQRKPDGVLSVPLRTLKDIDSIALGFRAEMLSLSDGKGKRIGYVTSGAGLGSDYLILGWGKKEVLVRGVDILKAWVETFDKEGAERIVP